MESLTASADNTVVVRLATEQDAAAVAVLLAELGYPSTAENVLSRLASLTADGVDQVWVAECDGEVAGFLSFHIIPLFHQDGGLGRITGMAVAAKHRRRGVGGSLVRTAEVFAQMHECARMEVTSGDQRADAHAFYEAAGYRSDIRRFLKRLS